jgi:hypothetical protein
MTSFCEGKLRRARKADPDLDMDMVFTKVDKDISVAEQRLAAVMERAMLPMQGAA